MYYLKYRPKNFSQLVGLENVVTVLQKALEKKQVAHAYIFTGPKGSGKTTTARILAKALNCERVGYGEPTSETKGMAKPKPLKAKASGNEPCNQCPTCQAVNEGRFLDLLEIDAASNRGIDDIRSLREKIRLVPSIGRFKVYIIDEVHMLTTEAFNALLKTLEEPPPHAVFILATTEFAKIPETIKSRCQILSFRRGSQTDLIKKLELICRQEQVSLNTERLAKIAELADGGFRNAENLLEQVVVGELDLDRLDFSLPTFVDLLVKADQKAILDYVERLATLGENLSFFTRGLTAYLRSLLLILARVDADTLDVGPDAYEVMVGLAGKFGRVNLIFALERLLRVEEETKYSPVPQLPLELALLDIVEKIEKPGNAAFDLPDSRLPPTTDAAVEPLAPASPWSGDLKELFQNWEKVLKSVRPFNHSLEALLRSARPKEFAKGGDLVIEVFYKFHKDKLSLPENVAVLQKVLASLFGVRPKISYVLGVKGTANGQGGLGGRASRPAPPGGPAQETPDELTAAALEAFAS